jgi:NAD(P)-dependent dehydrogenase (short-subunit alcohol dehydrogenase family)
MSNRPCVLITGANRGLGLGLAMEFRSRGWRVFGTCRRAADTPILTQAGIEALRVDVADESGVAAVLRHLATLTGSLDVLINNAGINPAPRDLTVADVPIALIAETMQVNVLGALRMLQAVLPLLRQSLNPRVVNISSGAGSLAHNSAQRPQPAYCLSKAALNMLTRRAARDLTDVTVVSISPGWIRTDMGGADAKLGVTEAATALAETIEQLNQTHSGQWLDRFGQPSEYAW